IINMITANKSRKIELTEGFFKNLPYGNTDDADDTKRLQPILQIMNSRFTKDGTGIRLRLNDGEHCYATILLKDKGFEKFKANEMDNTHQSIIKVLDYSARDITKDSVRRIFIRIKDFDLIEKDSPVNNKYINKRGFGSHNAPLIGTPIPYSGNPTDYHEMKFGDIVESSITNNGVNNEDIKKEIKDENKEERNNNDSNNDCSTIPITCISPYMMKWKNDVLIGLGKERECLVAVSCPLPRRYLELHQNRMKFLGNKIRIISCCSSKIIPCDGCEVTDQLKIWYGNITNIIGLVNEVPNFHGTNYDKNVSISTAKFLTKINKNKPIHYFNIVAKILKFQNLVYKSCTNGNCRKKVQMENNKYYCSKCQVTSEKFNYSFMVNIIIYDHSESYKATIFGDKATKLLEKTANEIGKILEENGENKGINIITKHLINTIYNFKIRTYISIYKDSETYNWTIIDIKPINVTKYSQHLATLHKEADDFCKKTK
uniref:Replication factor A C-terminal domain-containing protein n=2 Tax=Strongyloides stercoralis TaxID=6248 RepID=A0AAF5I2V4_STRER